MAKVEITADDLRVQIQQNLLSQMDFVPNGKLVDVCDELTGCIGSYRLLMEYPFTIGDLQQHAAEVAKRARWTPEYRRNFAEKFPPMLLPTSARSEHGTP